MKNQNTKFKLPIVSILKYSDNTVRKNILNVNVYVI